MVDYVGLKETVAELITDFGEARVYTLIRKVKGDYDPQTNKRRNLREDRTDFEAVISTFRDRDLADSRIRDEDKVLIFTPFNDVDGNEVRPTTSDIVEDGDKKLKIVAFEVIEPGSTTVLYRMFVRE